MITGSIPFAFALTAVAGLSTGIGSLIALFAKETNHKFLAVSLGFSAGVMVYISTIEIFPEARASLSIHLGEKLGYSMTVAAFFAGILLIAIIDKLIPEAQNPHEMKAPLGDKKDMPVHKGKLMRTGLFTALAIGIHNFPEGLATFVAALQEPTLAIPIVIAIAIHNIPEGISVAVPIYYATGSRKKAFLFSFASGLAEPVGALVGFLILLPFMNELAFGLLFALTAGIMVFISFDELLPAAQEYGEHHLAVYGLVAGMALTALSLLLLKN
ncbi:zinc transporter ZupT [Desulfococcaceae bacterium OttesenSCG-928-F15]|nr:zinc transporter ZupT [Desulfococcaceae bacterium OttesenSCG-928-F15]